jgi:hypothetical protein
VAGSSEPRTTTFGTQSLEAWAFVRRTLDDLTEVVRADAESELELIEGLRALARVSALASEVALDVDPDKPWFFDMNSPARLVGGPNPDGEYHLAMIDGADGRAYRVRGQRGSASYLGFQVLAGRGMTPRRMAAYVSDRDPSLGLADDGTFSFVLAAEQPSAEVLRGGPWVPIPDDASAVVVRQYIADRRSERPAVLAIDSLRRAGRPALPTDAAIAQALTAMAWTTVKLITLHRTIEPGLLEQPNRLVTASAADLGAADTTPDNLYMLGTFRLAADEALVLEIEPPRSRYWSITLENVWHECIEPRRRPSSVTNATAMPQRDGNVRIVVAATDPGMANWLDTGSRHRGWIVLRWLDNPTPPPVATHVVPLTELTERSAL